jgi:hypothetical protein
MINLQKILQLFHKNDWLWTLPEEEQREAEEIHDEWLAFASRENKERHNKFKAVKDIIRDWSSSPELVKFGKEARKRYLLGKLKQINQLFQRNRKMYVDLVRLNAPLEYRERLIIEARGLSKQINGYNVAVDILNGRRGISGIITEEQIVRALEYPLAKLLEVGNNGRAKCVWHNGTDWNMDIRKNYAHCYVCGRSGSVIDVYRAKTGAGFREAVNNLQ